MAYGGHCQDLIGEMLEGRLSLTARLGDLEWPET